MLEIPALCLAAAVATSSTTVQWNDAWPRFSTPEYIVTGSMIAAEASLLLFVSEPSETRFSGGLLFDDAARDLFRAESKDGRALAGLLSDAIYIGLSLYPLIVDAAIVAWGVHGNGDLAAQLALIDLQSLLISGLIALSTEKTVGRERPRARGCANDPDYHSDCNGGHLNLSFLSGHSALTFASATLTCVHHAHIPLYGGGAGDVAACAGGLGLATTTAILRIVTDAHYATDILAGATIGALAGYLVPTLLHYGFGGDGIAGSSAQLVPLANGDVLGLSMYARF